MTKTGPLFTGLALTAALLIACTNDTPPSAVAPAPGSGAPALEAAPADTGDTTTTGALDVQENPVPPADQGTATVALNPPHGEPGHRCEIPVGAPLDGSPAPAGSTTAPPVPSPAAMPINVPNNNTGMLNPPHGEPGHDCAVPVGSPLPG